MKIIDVFKNMKITKLLFAIFYTVVEFAMCLHGYSNWELFVLSLPLVAWVIADGLDGIRDV